MLWGYTLGSPGGDVGLDWLCAAVFVCGAFGMFWLFVRGLSAPLPPIPIEDAAAGFDVIPARPEPRTAPASIRSAVSRMRPAST